MTTAPIENTQLPSSADGRVYYGWTMVLIAAAAMAATLPGRTHGLALITKPLLDEFSTISSQQFAWINFWATLVGALFCLPCGWLIDRIGVRHLLGIVVLALGGAVIWMGRVEDRTSLAVAITLSRGIGQSMLSVLALALVGKWFQRRISPAMGLFAVVMTMLMAVSFGVVAEVEKSAGWRTAWQLIGWSLIAVAPMLWLFTREHPRSRLLEFSSERDAASRTLEPNATWQQAVATPCFWVFAGGISLFALVSTGVSLYQEYVLSERGLGKQVFTNGLIIAMLTGLVANMAIGGLLRKAPMQWLLAGCMLLLAATTVLLVYIQTPTHAYVIAGLSGFAGGGISVLFFAVWGHAYGPQQIGRIQGLAQMMTVFASASGPLLVANSRSVTGSYGFILTAFATASAVLGVIALFTPVPSAAAGDWRSAAAEPILIAEPESAP